jgi:hypothetical protein
MYKKKQQSLALCFMLLLKSHPLKLGQAVFTHTPDSPPTDSGALVCLFSFCLDMAVASCSLHGLNSWLSFSIFHPASFCNFFRPWMYLSVKGPLFPYKHSQRFMGLARFLIFLPGPFLLQLQLSNSLQFRYTQKATRKCYTISAQTIYKD